MKPRFRRVRCPCCGRRVRVIEDEGSAYSPYLAGDLREHAMRSGRGMTHARRRQSAREKRLADSVYELRLRLAHAVEMLASTD